MPIKLIAIHLNAIVSSHQRPTLKRLERFERLERLERLASISRRSAQHALVPQ